MGLDLKKEFELSDLAEEGKWFSLGEVDKDGKPVSRVKLRSTDSDTYNKALTRFRRRTRSNDDSSIRKITVNAMASALIVDWEGIDLEGKPLDCTFENRLMVLQEFRVFQDELLGLAADRSEFKSGSLGE
jgi:hypothetical protein